MTGNFFSRDTTRREYERMRRVARFWAAYDAPPDRWPPDYAGEFWELFAPAGPYPATPLADRLNDYANAKEIPY